MAKSTNDQGQQADREQQSQSGQETEVKPVDPKPAANDPRGNTNTFNDHKSLGLDKSEKK